MTYASLAKVRLRIQKLDASAANDALLSEGLACAQAVIDSRLGACGFTVPFADEPDTPAIICYMAAEMAAGWVLTRPLFSACSDEVPENGRLMWDSGKKILEALCDGRLKIDDNEVQTFGVISSTNYIFKERIKKFPVYCEPVDDNRPVIHPVYGEREDLDSFHDPLGTGRCFW